MTTISPKAIRTFVIVAMLSTGMMSVMYANKETDL